MIENKTKFCHAEQCMFKISYCAPSEHLAVEEVIKLLKRQVIFRQYIPKKLLSVHSPSANTCQFLKFKILKVLRITTCFSQYGHHQVLKYVVGETAAICYYCICGPSDVHVLCFMCCACSLLFFIACFILEKYPRSMNVLE
jgi:hypothetical protein